MTYQNLNQDDKITVSEITMGETSASDEQTQTTNVNSDTETEEINNTDDNEIDTNADTNVITDNNVSNDNETEINKTSEVSSDNDDIESNTTNEDEDDEFDEDDLEEIKANPKEVMRELLELTENYAKSKAEVKLLRKELKVQSKLMEDTLEDYKTQLFKANNNKDKLDIREDKQ
jgi:hypothetical protein